jgi:hypothetical protein
MANQIVANVRNLVARASNSAILSFPVSGIVQDSATLGGQTAALDFFAYYEALGSTNPEDPSRLTFDSAGILGSAPVTESIIGRLRAEPAKALLDAAVAGRQNAFFAKYANQAQVICSITKNYSQCGGIKPQALTQLANLSQQQKDLLQAAYTCPASAGICGAYACHAAGLGYAPRTGVVPSTFDHVHSQTCVSSNAYTYLQPQQTVGCTFEQSKEPTCCGWVTHEQSLTYVCSTTGPVKDSRGVSLPQCSYGSSVTGSTAYVAHTDYAYRVPSIENQMRFSREQASLTDEQFAQFMQSQNVPYLDTVFANELLAIDMAVHNLQVAYMDTLLLSPLDGIITGVWKYPGEYVRAGEPVARVEQVAPVYTQAGRNAPQIAMHLTGTLLCHEPITAGLTASVVTNLLGAPGPPTPVVTGTVIAARGAEDNEHAWDVVIETTNWDAVNNVAILPLNYHFDFDNTTVVLT